MPLSRGTRLGTYEITGLLGAGGMGEVYRAKDLRLGREVAVKVLPEAVASSSKRLARIEREARTIAGLNHPNIVVLHSIEEEGGIRFLTMELVEGQSLDRFVTTAGLHLSHLLDLIIPLADALIAAHEKGIVHRDLKPGNVMVSREGRVKVLDFGLAKLMGGGLNAESETVTVTEGAPLSEVGRVMGTVPYMAPEQIRGEIVDARSDLFALGIMLYELATGRRPFTGTNSADVSSSILRDTPEPLTNIRSDLPGDFNRIVARCLEKNPRERFQTALDVCNELRRVKHALGSGAPPKPSFEGVASIAVLPFVNRSASEEDEYFSDGIADELINMLAKVRDLRVAARTSSFTFKGKEVTIAEVGKALNVATVLEGSVRKSGNRVRVSVQLVKVKDGYHFWSETYDRTLDDIFAVQDDIAHSVVKELRIALLGKSRDPEGDRQISEDLALTSRGRGQNPEAHRLYLQGRYFVDRLTREDTTKGIRYLREALVLDPTFALAWAELSRAHMREVNSNWVSSTEGTLRARKAVERAFALEPDLAEAHASMGWIRGVGEWDWQGAEASFRRALQLAPGNATALRGAGRSARRFGRLGESIDLLRDALARDPLNTMAHSGLGTACLFAGRLTESEASYRGAIDLTPLRDGCQAALSLALLAQGRDEEAMEQAMREPAEDRRLYALAQIHHVARRMKASEDALRELTEKHAMTMASEIAELHAARGETDRAFEWLERAYAQRDGGLSDMRVAPGLRTLHDDPRWAAFLKKMGLDDVEMGRPKPDVPTRCR